MITWAGWLIVAFGTAHTVGALTVLGAGQHAGTWLTGGLWDESLLTMGPALSAYWLSINSFGPAFIVIGFIVLWLARRGVTPPAFIGWALGAWTIVDNVLSGVGFGQGLIPLVAAGLLVAAAFRAKRLDRAAAADRRPEPVAS